MISSSEEKEELTVFDQMLQTFEGPAWLLNIEGDGGVGKSSLLTRFAQIAHSQGGTLCGVVDVCDWVTFSPTPWQYDARILKCIADKLAPTQMPPFYQAFDRYQHLSGTSKSCAWVAHEIEIALLQEQFYKIYAGLNPDRILLLIDTIDTASNAHIQPWVAVIAKLREVNPKTMAVVATRRPIVVSPSQAVVSRRLEGLSVREIKQYLDGRSIVLPAHIVAQLSRFTRGCPLFIALTIDWINLGNDPSDLLQYGPDHLGQIMVELVQRLPYLDSLIVMNLAHLNGFCDDRILAHSLGRPLEMVSKLSNALQRFSWIKSCDQDDYQPCRHALHSEVCSLITDVWSSLDPMGENRSAWDKRLTEYYGQRSEAELDPQERQSLELARLPHWLAYDLNPAFEHATELFGQAMEACDVAFMDAIHGHLRRVTDQLEPRMLRQLELQEAIVLHQQGRYPEAANRILRLLEDDSDALELKLRIRATAVELLLDSGDPQRGLEIGLETEARFETWLYDTPISDLGQMELSFGMLCTNIGNAYRVTGQLESVVAYYNKALLHLSAGHASKHQVAAIRNNLGYVYQRLGHSDEALAECQTSLGIRQQLNSPFELGLSYNALGMIHTDRLRVDEAVGCFERALHAFTDAGSERGRALVFVAYGRLMRQWGWYKEEFAKEPHAPNRYEYQQAGRKLDEAVEILRRTGDTANLLEALNEKGTLLRHQRLWEQALVLYEESANLAWRIGNQYRQVDNLLDIGITYYAAGQPDRALEYAQRASSMAHAIGAYYLFSRSERTVAQVLYDRNDYEGAFAAASNACAYVLVLDSNRPGEAPAKRQLLYDEVVKWVCGLISGLPSRELAASKVRSLIEHWGTERIAGQLLRQVYPGFVPRLLGLAQERDLNLPMAMSGDRLQCVEPESLDSSAKKTTADNLPVSEAVRAPVPPLIPAEPFKREPFPDEQIRGSANATSDSLYTPPDLILQIGLSADKQTLLYTLLSPNLEEYNLKPVGSVTLKSDPRVLLQHAFDRLSTYARQSTGERSSSETERVSQELSDLGMNLYKYLFPPELITEYCNISQKYPGKCLQITSDEPWIPWELVRPYDCGKHPGPQSGDPPLCEIFRVSGWPTGRAAPGRILVRNIAVTLPPTNLRFAKNEAEYWTGSWQLEKMQYRKTYYGAPGAGRAIQRCTRRSSWALDCLAERIWSRNRWRWWRTRCCSCRRSAGGTCEMAKRVAWSEVGPGSNSQAPSRWMRRRTKPFWPVVDKRRRLRSRNSLSRSLLVRGRAGRS